MNLINSLTSPSALYLSKHCYVSVFWNIFRNMAKHFTWERYYQFNLQIWSPAFSPVMSVSPNTIFSEIFPGRLVLNLFYSGQKHYDPLVQWNTDSWTIPFTSLDELFQESLDKIANLQLPLEAENVISISGQNIAESLTTDLFLAIIPKPSRRSLF